ncbi:glycosyl transferase [Leptolyngbya valderiana BDU 20041]|nr:glycosyl transferase [Leptolyngbya valderiana BDU 20041]
MVDLRVSVIVPTYNGEAYIQLAIASVLHQTYRHWELVVVDDGSTDSTREIVTEYGDRIRYFYQENQGVAAARNRGIREARGEWVAFLDQDDFFVPEKLAVQVAALEKQPSVGIVHSGWQILDRSGNMVSSVEPWHGIPELDVASWLLWKPVFLGAMLFRRDWLEFAGGFNCRFHQAPDVDLVLRLALMGCEAVWVPQTTVGYRQHDRNASQNTQVQVLECEEVLDRLFARSNLSEELRRLERQARYNNMVWSAWRLYYTGKLADMANCLERSLRYTSRSRTETILDWIGWFRQYSLEYGCQFDAAVLGNSVEWQKLLTYFV